MLGFRTMRRKAHTFIQWVLLYRNWPTALRINLVRTGREVTVSTRNGIRVFIRPGTNDFGVFNEIHCKKSYTPTGFGISPDDTVLDIGANIGSFSLYAANIVQGGRGRVLAFEPMEDNYRQLCRNISLNGYSNHVIPKNQAVTDQIGSVSLYLSTEQEKDGFLHCVNMGKHTTEVSCSGHGSPTAIISSITLDNIVSTYNLETVDFVKMDCEGAEYRIWFNASDNTLKKIRRIAMECHETDTNKESDLIVFFRRKGFQVNFKNPYLYASKA